MTDAPVAEAIVGHNAPPPDTEILRERLTLDHAVLLKRVADLEAAILRTPAKVEDDAAAGKLADFVRQLQTCKKELQAQKDKEKAPLQLLADTAYAFFIQPAGRLDAGIKSIEQRLTAYQREKEDRRRAEAAEKLRKEQALAREKQRLADEKFAVAQAEIRKSQEATRRANAARLASEEATRRAKAAEAAALIAVAENKPAKAEKLLATAAAKRVVAETKAVTADVITQQAEAGMDRADVAFVDSLDQRDGVARHHVEIEGANRIVTASAADLTRTRGDLGSVQSLKRTWSFKVTDIDAVPRKYLRVDDQVVQLDITRSKGRVTIPGIEITEDKNVRVS